MCVGPKEVKGQSQKLQLKSIEDTDVTGMFTSNSQVPVSGRDVLLLSHMGIRMQTT